MRAHRRRLLRPLVPAILRVEVELAPVLPALGGERLRRLDPRDEAVRRPPQRELRVDVEPPRRVHRREQQVAELVRDARVGLALGRRRAGDGDLGLAARASSSASFSSGAGDVRPVEAGRRRAPLHLARVKQRRQRLGHVVEDALALLLLDLQPLPVLAHAAGGLRLRVAEDVRMARDELRVDRARDGLEVAGAALGEQQREEVGLEEQVAELVEQLGVVARERGVGDLVGLLDRVRHDRALRLLAIPGALAAQALGQLLELDQRVGERHYPVVVAGVGVLRRTDRGSACSRSGT